MRTENAGSAAGSSREELARRYEEYKNEGLKLDMSRGKPSKEQLDLSQGLLRALQSNEETQYEGCDVRNYGVPAGLPGIRRLFGALLGLPEDRMFIGGCSSLELMFDTFARHMLFGAQPGMTPWSKEKEIFVLCPSPGYDRHFAISECFGARNVPIPMTDTGPDMDAVEEAVKDPRVKAIWCVPKYSNPTGVTFSEDTVRRFARLEPKAKDFRIFWDNAYFIHDLYDKGETLLNLYTELEALGKTDSAYIFSSFSKVTYAGGSVSMMASGKENMDYAMKVIGKQIICTDKVNQLRHLLFFGNAEGVLAHMKKHAAILRPKFEAVLEVFDRELSTIARYSRPKGGYFIDLRLPRGTAKRTYELCRAAGVTLTTCGATYPYGNDPLDSDLRIAPSLPPVEDLKKAAEILSVCARIAYAEKYRST